MHFGRLHVVFVTDVDAIHFVVHGHVAVPRRSQNSGAHAEVEQISKNPTSSLIIVRVVEYLSVEIVIA